MKFTRLRLAAALVVSIVAVLAVEAGGGGAQPSRASAATVSPQAALDWNLIAVNTVRAAAPAKFQIEGTLYMSYVQAAVYDAVTTIKGRYLPYHALALKDPVRLRVPRSQRPRTRRCRTTSRRRRRRWRAPTPTTSTSRCKLCRRPPSRRVWRLGPLRPPI